MSDYFIGIYTNKVKEYCDKEFFNRIDELKKDNYVGIVDNTIGTDYFKKIVRLTKNNVYQLSVPKEPKRTQFLRNVEASVNSLRSDFLFGDWKYFLIIESDVIPPVDLIDRLDKDIEKLNNVWYKTEPIKEGLFEVKTENTKPWGAIGGIYYKGFHDFDKEGLQPTNHVLSGCTVYKRELISRLPFRWSEDNVGAFPDAWISYDAINAGYSLWNDHDIKCEHLEISHGNRGHGNL